MLITFPYCYRIAWDIETDNYDTFQSLTQLLKISQHSARRLQVYWSHGVKYQKENAKDAFRVTKCITHQQPATKQKAGEEVQAPTQYLEINDLEHNTNYTITVMASTNKGYGPASEAISVATDQDHTVS